MLPIPAYRVEPQQECLQLTLSLGPETIAISISPARVLSVLLVAISVLSSASIAAHLYSNAFRQRSFFVLFDLEAEGNLSTWFASTLLLAAAGLLYLITRTSPAALAGRWKLLSIMFVYVAIDEAAQLHEFTILPLRAALHLSGFFYFSWVVLAMPILGFLAIRYIPFLRALPRRVRNLAFAAAIIYLAGALGMEMINGAHAEIYGYKTLTYKLMTDLEETLELVGITLWIFTLLTYMEGLAGSSSHRARPAIAR
jgi:hypothetical protein